MAKRDGSGPDRCIQGPESTGEEEQGAGRVREGFPGPSRPARGAAPSLPTASKPERGEPRSSLPRWSLPQSPWHGEVVRHLRHLPWARSTSRVRSLPPRPSVASSAGRIHPQGCVLDSLWSFRSQPNVTASEGPSLATCQRQDPLSFSLLRPRSPRLDLRSCHLFE